MNTKSSQCTSGDLSPTLRTGSSTGGTSAAHTAGPWVINHVPTSAGSAYRIGQPGLEKGCAWIYADGLRKGIDDKLPRAIELGANAVLISAAPDLLEALTGIFALIDEGWLVRNIADDGEPGFAMRQLKPLNTLAKAQTALAKATGA